MKRILGIILGVLSCIAFLALLVWGGVIKGYTLGFSILVVLASIVITAIIFGLTYLVLWLLN